MANEKNGNSPAQAPSGEQTLKALAENPLAVSAGAILFGALAYVGQELAAKLLARQWDWPAMATGIGGAVVAGLLGLLFIEKKKRAREVGMLNGRISDIWRELKEHRPALIPEAQEINTEFILAINDRAGDDAKVTKECVFRVLVAGIAQIREDMKFDGKPGAPQFEIEHYVGEYDVDDALSHAVPQLEEGNWRKVPGDIAVKKGAKPWTSDWVFTLPAELEPGHIYRKRIIFKPRESFLGADEYHSHQFVIEAHTRIRVLFNAEYADGLPRKWLDGSAPLPVAYLRRRFFADSNPHISPRENVGGVVEFLYERKKPQVGDRFRLEWSNPTGRAKA